MFRSSVPRAPSPAPDTSSPPGQERILVDCGLFQGLKALRLRNREPLPFDPHGLDAVVLTHAHLDHSGFLPVLVKAGYAGPIYCTAPTADLVPILLSDSGHLQEEDARWAKKKGFSRHRQAEPLYTEEDARRVTRQLKPVPVGRPVDLGGVTLTYSLAGHILGAASALRRPTVAGCSSPGTWDDRRTCSSRHRSRRRRRTGW